VEHFLLLAVGELHVDHTAEAFHHRQGIEFSAGLIVDDMPEVSPVDLKLLGRFRFNVLICFGKSFLFALFSQIVSDNGLFAVKALCGQMLQDHRR
jgi:hypothetical protein